MRSPMKLIFKQIVIQFSLCGFSVVPLFAQAAASAPTTKPMSAAYHSVRPIAKLTRAATMHKQLFGYYTNWSIYQKEYHPKDMPLQNLTAVIYAFTQVGNCAPPDDDHPTPCGKGAYATGIQNYQLYSTDPYADFAVIPQGYFHAGEKGADTMGEFIRTAHAKKKTALLSIGGATLSVPLTVAMQPEHRAEFIRSIIQFLKDVKKQNQEDGFDGIDVDWEPADWWAVKGEQINNFVAFLRELKLALQTQYADYAWLTIATWADPRVVAKVGVNSWQQIGEVVDYINVMAYDYHGGFDIPRLTNLMAPLSPEPNEPDIVVGSHIFNVETTVKAYLNYGAPARKLIIGFPAYARGVDGVDSLVTFELPEVMGLYLPFGGNMPGQFKDNSGMYDYNYLLKEFMNYEKHDDCESYQVAGTSFMYCTKDKYFLSYDSPSDVTQKAAYVLSKNLAGMMVWELAGDVAGNDANSLVHAAYVGLSE